MSESFVEELSEESGFHSLLGHLDDVVVWVDELPSTEDEPSFRYVSPGFEGIWGRSPETLLNDPSVLIESAPPEDRDLLRERIAAARENDGTLSPFEHRVVQPDGEVRWVEVRGFHVGGEGSDATALVGITIDITERKRAERDLERANERLQEFARIASHDLRNPLTVASMNLELARDESESDNLAEVARALERMDELIDDLLTLARQGDATTEVAPVSLAALVEECWRTVDTEDATLNVETDRTVLADRSRLRQLLENLVRNAVEHGGASVTVTVEDTADGFAVEDDGAGIPVEAGDRVFERGYSTAADGTGFGLSIVRRVAELHDWEVRVAEGSDGGARFEVRGVEWD